MKDIIIGIDVGGTKIMSGAINTNGEVLCDPVKLPTLGSSSDDVIMGNIIQSVELLLHELNVQRSEIQGIGIGCTGPLDIENGVILECPQLPNMHFYPLKEAIAKHFELPTQMNNDANCMIFGEAVFGTAKEADNVLGFTLGTGIGCAVIMNGRIINGARNAAGEIWASPYQDGTIEDFISGHGVSRIYKSLTGADKSSMEVGILARKGDETALKTWEAFGQHLAIPLAWSINLLDPDVVVLGGSISNAYPFFEKALLETLKPLICPVPGKFPKISLAALGDYAGFIGAASLVLEPN